MIACPTCGSATTVEETRGERRRRACTKCGRKLTTIEVLVENARRYDKIAVMPRRDLETLVKLTGKAMASLVGDEGVIALLSEAGTSAEATPAPALEETVPRTREESPQSAPPLDPAPEEENTAEEGNALTEEELRAIGVDPDNEEQLAALGLIVQGSD